MSFPYMKISEVDAEMCGSVVFPSVAPPAVNNPSTVELSLSFTPAVVTSTCSLLASPTLTIEFAPSTVRLLPLTWTLVPSNINALLLPLPT